MIRPKSPELPGRALPHHPVRPAYDVMLRLFCYFLPAFPVLRAASHGYAATVHPLATAAALEAMKSGGKRRLPDFAQHGVPNVFSQIGGEANAVAPGKRPLSSMSPTLVQKDGRPILVIGAAGGPTILSQVVLGSVRTADFRLPPWEALPAPRFHHQWQPDVLRIENAITADTHDALEKRGRILNLVPGIGISQAVNRRPDGSFSGAANPRGGGTAAGF